MEHRNINIPRSPTSPEKDYDIFLVDIKPKFVLEKGIPKQITKLHDKFILKGLIIRRLNNKLMNVKIFGSHPNADLNTDEICLKDEEYGAEVKDVATLASYLINRLEVYYFDESHFRPDSRQYETKPVDGFMKIDVNFDKGEIHDGEAPFRRLYPKEDQGRIG